MNIFNPDPFLRHPYHILLGRKGGGGKIAHRTTLQWPLQKEVENDGKRFFPVFFVL